jgi:hypothetical protein
MTKYLILYRSSTPPSEMGNMTPEQAKEGMEAWMTWAGKTGSALVDLGAPVQSDGSVGKGGSTGQPVCGFSILEADSVDAIKKVLDGHPHFMSPGDNSIEILEYLPVPGM